ncbi:MAG: response regulator [Magnetococcales bacterium]|nr:response regulator [Magnetococcales bacterium]NGZ28204.1 response regulator [Magnetococcales bacterium]
MDTYPGHVVEILLVEDSPGDVELTKEALADSRIVNRLYVVEDGEQAIEFLERRGRYTDAIRPDLVLLDLNLPRKDGREVLQFIKSSDELASIPVVILTTSRAEEDILKSYELHANCYITKPVDIFQFFKVIKSIEDFWLTVVKLPRKL